MKTDCIIKKLYEDYAKHMKDFSQRRFCSQEESEDVVHDIFLKLIDRTELIENRSQIGGYLTQATRNESLSQLRRKKRFKDCDYIDEMPDCRPEIIEEKQSFERLSEAFRAAITAMPAGSAKRVASMFYLKNRSTFQIAADLGLSQNTVLSHLHRFRKRLKGLVASHEKIEALEPFGLF